MSQDPHTTLRYTRNAKVEEIIAQVEAENGKPRLGYYSPRALIFKGYASVQRTAAFKDGWFEIQDEGSQVMSAFTLADATVAKALKDKPSTERSVYDAKALEAELAALKAMTVVDACAGSGGKTLALADFMRGQGRVYGYDIYAKKVQALKKRVERAGERSVQAVHLENESTESLKKFEGKVDRLLIDSPCSGWGVLRRNPDIKWNRKPRVLGAMAHPDRPITEAQHAVIHAYLPLLKPGGVMVYGVCTFQKAETVDQVAWIEKQFPELELRHSGFIGPHETDGFFMASFSRV
jgi:16S rRNA (cytosine967-C5)-methyltransferase